MENALLPEPADPGALVHRSGRTVATIRPLLARMANRTAAALPAAALFAPVYAALVDAGVFAHLVLAERIGSPRVATVLVLFAGGAALAGFLSWIIAAAIAGGRPFPARFAAMTLILTIGTVGCTAIAFFLHYRGYYAQWHDDVGTRHWIIQQIFTGGSAVYIFAISGLKLMLPFGLFPLFGSAFLFARRAGR